MVRTYGIAYTAAVRSFLFLQYTRNLCGYFLGMENMTVALLVEKAMVGEGVRTVRSPFAVSPTGGAQVGRL